MEIEQFKPGSFPELPDVIRSAEKRDGKGWCCNSRCFSQPDNTNPTATFDKCPVCNENSLFGSVALLALLKAALDGRLPGFNLSDVIQKIERPN